MGVACSHIRRDNLLLSSWPECMGGVALIAFKDDKAEIFAGIYVNGMRGSGACDVDAYAVFVRLHVVCINTFHCCIISNVFDRSTVPIPREHLSLTLIVGHIPIIFRLTIDVGFDYLPFLISILWPVGGTR